MKLLNALIWNKIPIYFQRAAIQKLNDNNNNNNGFIGKKETLVQDIQTKQSLYSNSSPSST